MHAPITPDETVRPPLSARRKWRPNPSRPLARMLSRLTATLLLAVLAGLPLASDAPAASSWRSDAFSASAGARPPFAGWEHTPYNVYGGGSVSMISDPVKGRVLRSFGAANQFRYDGYRNQRAEQVPSFVLRPGQTVWLGFDFWVNPGLGVSRTWQGLFQMRSATEGASLLGLSVNVHEAGTMRIGSSSESRPLGSTPYGRWTRIVLGMHVSSDSRQAWVEAWRDGVNAMRSQRWRTANAGAAFNYVKFGVYRGPQPFHAEFRYANIALGSSLNAVR